MLRFLPFIVLALTPAIGQEIPLPELRPVTVALEVPLPEPRPQFPKSTIPFPDPRPEILATRETIVPLPNPRPVNLPANQLPAISLKPTTQSNSVNCLEKLRELNVFFSRASRNGPGSCGLKSGVEVASFNGVRLMPPGAMTCEVALSTAEWLAQSVSPETQRYFGRGLAGVNQVSTYACRKRPSGKLSEHATGNAIDISSLVLSDGTEISVLDWSNKGRRSKYLRKIANTSCTFFSVVLTPKSDAAHRDHFHLDRGAWRQCDG